MIRLTRFFCIMIFSLLMWGCSESKFSEGGTVGMPNTTVYVITTLDTNSYNIFYGNDTEKAMEVVNTVFDRSEKIVDDTKDFIGWQITKICIWVFVILVVAAIVLLLIKSSTASKSRGGYARRRAARSTRHR